MTRKLALCCRSGPPAADEVSRLLSQVKPTLPLLLWRTSPTISQILLTYNPSLRQLLVLLPPTVASSQSFGLPQNNPTGLVLGMRPCRSNRPACTVGFLPPSSWRSPADTTTADTPDGLYCKVPQDSPISVRGARNYPCMGQPGKRAPTVQICKSDKPYEPLAMRPHILGRIRIPNLLAQGIPPDDRVTFNGHEYLPPEGTPHRLADPTSKESPRRPGPPKTPPPTQPPAPTGDPVPAAPSAYTPGRAALRPQIGSARADPLTGYYVAADGRIYRQSNPGPAAAPRSWKELLRG